MSFNGSGQFNINSAGQPVVGGTTITASVQNALTADLATGLSTAICKDGQQTITADIPFNNHKLTGIALATARTDAASLATIQDGTGVYVSTVGGTGDAITLSPAPAITGYVAGQRFQYLSTAANTTAVTVAISGLAAKAVTKNGTTALVANDILSGMMVQFTYDGTRFILGTHLTADIVTLAGTQILTNKTLTGGLVTADPTVDLGIASKVYVDNHMASPIINGNMEVWQRGTTFAAAANLAYTVDRFIWGTIGAGVVTINRSTNVPTVVQAGLLFNYSLEVDVTTADAAIAATDIYILSQKIEGYNWRHFAQRTLMLSFWVMSTKTGIHSVGVQNTGQDRAYAAEYTINTTNTWEYKTVAIAASPSAGTWDYTVGTGLFLRWVLAAGSNFTTGSLSTWTSSALYASTNQVNAMDNAANFFRLTGVKLELGAVASPIRYRAIQEELHLCKRYYQKSFAYATTPVQNVGTIVGSTIFGSMVGATTDFQAGPIQLSPTMRSTPTIVLYNPRAANAEIRNDSLSTDCTVSGSVGVGEQSFSPAATTPAATVAGHRLAINWTADAEL